ncbi:MAG: hypothetical protein WCR82_05760 [Bacteroidales bacterium]|jgi:hypothetical protein
MTNDEVKESISKSFNTDWDKNQKIKKVVETAFWIIIAFSCIYILAGACICLYLDIGKYEVLIFVASIPIFLLNIIIIGLIKIFFYMSQ